MILSVEKDKLINEISLLPEDKLEEVYNIIHYFRLGTEKEKENDILSFSGSWKDMGDNKFDDYLSDIAERRNKAFSSRGR
ncbi:MAG: hypothetical protein KAH22_06815 [Thiotrichaceae bacterium]|nr:hypothetical protein [Thiotrichaceae bacterium]